MRKLVEPFRALALVAWAAACVAVTLARLVWGRR